MNTLKVYLASGWFNDRDDNILTNLEETLCALKYLKVYRPRKDGVKLSAEDFHDHNLRKKVFDSNVENIDSADLVVANLDCGSDRLDTGTVWECARAVAKGIPVIIYNEVADEILTSRLGSLVHVPGIQFAKSISELVYLTEGFYRVPIHYPPLKVSHKVTTDRPALICDENSTDLITTILDTITQVDVVTDPRRGESVMIDILDRAGYLILPTDSKDPVITWYMSVAYYLNVPIITYSENNLPLNLMLIFSVRKHVQGVDDLRSTVSFISRNGLRSLPSYSTEGVKVY